MLLWIVVAVVLILFVCRVMAGAMSQALRSQRRYEAEQEIQGLKRQTIAAMFEEARPGLDERPYPPGSDVIESEAWDQ